jgi:5'-3' exonuclease
MGIKTLNKLLRSKCPEVFVDIHISEFAYKKVSIDVSLFLCKFKSFSDNWLESFVNLILLLRKNDIHCVFIFDNGHPPEKIQEREERAISRENNKARVDTLENALNNYEQNDVWDNVLEELYSKQDGLINHSLLVKGQKIKILREIVENKKKAIWTITPEDWLNLRRLFTIMNVSYYDAPLEAETMCADLCKRGLVSAAISEDTDVIAYGAPVFLTKIDIYRGRAVKILYSDILKSLNLTSEQFLDLCIMCGTDYNKNIPNVGSQTAYKYINMYGSIEEIGKQKNFDLSVLKYEKSRELFTDYKRYDFDKEIPYNGQPDYEKLSVFFFEMKISVDMSIIKECYIPKIIFEKI